MITASVTPRQLETRTWQQELAEAITTPEELAAALDLSPRDLLGARAAGRHFRLRVPRSFVARMRPGDPADPLLRQVLPAAAELADEAEYIDDPVRERGALRARALLQKYRGRALLLTTSTCAVHCRYCFRREFPYADHSGDAPRWSEALAEIRADTSLEEIILSGGDPLSLSNARLESLSRALAAIPHVRRIRVHTRQPVVLPSRVDGGLLQWLRTAVLPTVLVLHVNHPNELDAELAAACGRLRATGATLLNQSVLLAGINDDADVLAELSQRLFDAGVLPYYLHALDRVRGAAHFAVPDERAQALAGRLAARLPGYLVPRLVREVAGAPAKVTLGPIF
ncbi:MAG TPA: EF-P beta-lysylation protein EpmB [Steroidobacteraceae bacterium]|jgi:EF-P beta-lysylation protein EpmB|nr:EF-P beta-lysylation protein EpmB [Steroidobacteraceae bacterium]